MAVDNRGAECGGVGRFQVVCGDIHVKAVASLFWATVYGEVFGGGDGPWVVGGVPLQATDEAHCKLAGEVGVFTVGFHAAAPTWVTENVDVRGPEGESCIAGVVFAGAAGEVEFWARASVEVTSADVLQ